MCGQRERRQSAALLNVFSAASASEEPALGSDFWSIQLHCFQMVLRNRSLSHGGNPGIPKMPAHPADPAIGRTARRQAGADQKSRTEENTVETATVCDSESVWSSGTFLDGASDVSTCCGDTEPGVNPGVRTKRRRKRRRHSRRKSEAQGEWPFVHGHLFQTAAKCAYVAFCTVRGLAVFL